MKKCSRCGETKALAEFARDRRLKTGISSKCHVCNRAMAAAWRENNRDRDRANASRWVKEHPEQARKARALWARNNPDKVRAMKRSYAAEHQEEAARYMREWRANNKERANAWAQRWRDANREKVRAADRRWREAHPEAIRAKDRRRQQEHPEVWAEYVSRRRVRLLGNGVEEVDRLAIYDRDHGICHLCTLVVSRDRFTLDHLQPVSLGGRHSPDNVMVAHKSCNSRRGVKPVEEARKLLSP